MHVNGKRVLQFISLGSNVHMYIHYLSSAWASLRHINCSMGGVDMMILDYAKWLKSKWIVWSWRHIVLVSLSFMISCNIKICPIHIFKNQWVVKAPAVAIYMMEVYDGWSLTPINHFNSTWWRHQMEPFSALLALCAGNSPAPDKFPAQRPVMRSFDVFFDVRPNKRLSKQSWGWWFEMPAIASIMESL